MNDDECILVQVESLSSEEIGHAGVKDISEIRDYRIREDGNRTIHTMDFGEGSYLSITYSIVDNNLKVEAHELRKVRFERLGESLFIAKDAYV